MLASVTIPASVEKIGALAFYDSGLKSVVIEYGSILASIGSFVSEICLFIFIFCLCPQ